MPAALVRLIQTEFIEICWKISTSSLMVRWPQISMLTCILTTGNFIPKYVVILGGFQNIRGPSTGRLGSKVREIQQDNGYGATSTVPKTARTYCQDAVHNLSYIHSLQVGTGFNILLEMEIAEDMIRAAIPLTNVGLPFCLSYQLKGVCNSNYGGQNTHIVLLDREHILLAALENQLCGAATTPVLKIDTGLI